MPRSDACLGSVTGEVWTRSGRVRKPHRERQLPASGNSACWLRCAEQVSSPGKARGDDHRDRPTARVTSMAGMGPACPDPGSIWPTRASTDRKLANGGDLFAVGAQTSPLAGTASLSAAATAIARPRPPEHPQPSRWRFGEVHHPPAAPRERPFAAQDVAPAGSFDGVKISPPKGVEPESSPSTTPCAEPAPPMYGNYFPGKTKASLDHRTGSSRHEIPRPRA